MPTPPTPSASGTHGVRLHRVLAAPPARVYRAFVDPAAIAKWLPPHGFVCEVQHMDVRVGGGFRMGFRNLGTGHSHHFGGTYLEVEPDARLRYTDVFDDPNLPGDMVTTITLRAVSCGTELVAEQVGIPAAIPNEACMLGWQQSLELLALLVTPDIPA